MYIARSFFMQFYATKLRIMNFPKKDPNQTYLLCNYQASCFLAIVVYHLEIQRC